MLLTSADVKSVFVRFDELITAYRSALNELNVYPVPDGDTGSNMAGTVRRIIDELEGTETMQSVTDAIAHGSLMGAKGNSGILLSVILSGMAEAFGGLETIGATEIKRALSLATDSAYRAVAKPVEGTILTVVREASEAADDEDGDVSALVAAIYGRSVEALARTPEALPVLEQAGVVDAGGAGLILLFAAFAETAGHDVALPDHLLTAHAHLERIEEGSTPSVSDLRYEVMFFVDSDEESIENLKDRWMDLGDSIVVTGSGGVWNCHIHTDHIGPSIEAGIGAGQLSDIRVTDLRESVGRHESVFLPLDEASVAPIGVISVVAGDGLIDVFRSFGVQGVIRGGQSMNPSTEELLAMVEAIPAPEVILLPNNKNIVPVAEQIDNLSTKSVHVVPTRSVPQGVAAMLAFSTASTDLLETAEEMAAAASSVMTGEVTRAIRDAFVGDLSISAGDWLGLADGTIVVAGPDLDAVLRGLVAELMPVESAEVVTLYTGVGAAPHATKSLQAYLGELHPEVEVTVVEGGQPTYPYLLSVE